MKKFVQTLICCVLIACSIGTPKVHAEGFFISLRGETDNLWSNLALDLLQTPIYVFSNSIVCVETGVTEARYKFKDNGEPILMEENKFLGFKARDMFHYLDVGGKIGWQDDYSPIGVYGQCYYNVNNFRLKFADAADFEKYRSNMIKLGVGIRLNPLPENDNSLFVEVGSTYNIVVGGVTPYGHDKAQFNNGVASNYAIGYIYKGTDKIETVSLGVELNHYNFFNKEYSNDGGYYFPYANTKSNSIILRLKYTISFMSW